MEMVTTVGKYKTLPLTFNLSKIYLIDYSKNNNDVFWGLHAGVKYMTAIAQRVQEQKWKCS